jgi:ribosome-associated protein
MPSDLRVNERLVIPAAEIRLSATRSSGPGGQHVNTAATRVQLRWNLHRTAVLSEAERRLAGERLASRLNKEGELILECTTYRSQHRNRQACLRRLAVILRKALHRDTPRVKTLPPAAVAERRLQEKKHRSAVKRLRRTPARDGED